MSKQTDTDKLAEEGVANVCLAMFKNSEAGDYEEALTIGEVAIACIRDLMVDIINKSIREGNKDAPTQQSD